MMPTAPAPAPRPQPAIRVVRFYKMDHLGDPVLLTNGRIRLGVENCKAQLRAGIKQLDLDRRDNLIISIGGITAKDGLWDRLVWAGIPAARQPDGCIDSEDGFYLMQDGPLEWRNEFPDIADFVDGVSEGHRVGRISRLKGEPERSITPQLCYEFIRLFEWGKQRQRAVGQPAPPKKQTGGCPPPPCPPPSPRGEP